MNEWQNKAHSALERKKQLKFFGNYATGIFIEGKHGSFVVDPEDNSVAKSLLQSGEYSESELNIANNLINIKSNVLIVGAHIGALAVPLSKKCNLMDVIEANPDTQKFLRANIDINKCSNVTLHYITLPCCQR